MVALVVTDSARGASIIVPSLAAGSSTPPGVSPTAGGVLLGISNISAAGDPGATNDVNSGMAVGSIWFNSTAGALRAWMCRDNTAGAAKWTFEGADYPNGGTNPAAEATAAGSSTASIAAEGNVYRQVIAVPGTNPVATGSDIVIGVYNLPANALDGATIATGTGSFVSNRGLTVTAQGSFGGTGNNKTVKIIVGVQGTVGSVIPGGGTAIASTGVVSTNGNGWSLQANIFKYGAGGSNTQLGIHQQAQVGGAVSTLVAPQNLTLAENAVIPINITANCATLANDVALNFIEVNFCN